MTKSLNEQNDHDADKIDFKMLTPAQKSYLAEGMLAIAGIGLGPEYINGFIKDAKKKFEEGWGADNVWPAMWPPKKDPNDTK